MPQIPSTPRIRAAGVIRSHNREYGRHDPAGQWGRPVLLTRKIERAKHLQLSPPHAMATAMNDENEPKTRPTSGVRLAPGVRVREEDIQISFVRSSGPGGQNVNKRATKAQLRIALASIPLDAHAMKRLRRLAGNAITNDDELLIEADETRSQSRNKKASIERLSELVTRAATRPKTRKPTKPTRGAIRRRLEEKSQNAEKKRRRRPPKDAE